VIAVAVAPIGSRPAKTGVSVVAGKPSEFKFALSKHVVPHGTVVFAVRNGGTIVHDFKICKVARTNIAANTCNGTGSAKLSPGQSTHLTATLAKAGKYEYLCTVTGHAVAGMKGLLTVK
jgi:uncharacterized cupredoxin-like copper-binding protein